jgi:hypothetical protein
MPDVSPPAGRVDDQDWPDASWVFDDDRLTVRTPVGDVIFARGDAAAYRWVKAVGPPGSSGGTPVADLLAAIGCASRKPVRRATNLCSVANRYLGRVQGLSAWLKPRWAEGGEGCVVRWVPKG